jgi:hypothetical protein
LPSTQIEKIDTCRVAARPGEAGDKTKPDRGSSLTMKTTGIVVVAAFAANAGLIPPVAAITATCLRTNSDAGSGSRCILFSAQR